MPIKYIICRDCGRKVPYNKAIAAPDEKGDLCEDCYNSRKLNEKETERKAQERKGKSNP